MARNICVFLEAHVAQPNRGNLSLLEALIPIFFAVRGLLCG